MFTGIVAEMGTIRAVRDRAASRLFVVSASFTEVVLGESIALDGVCLTVEGVEPGAFQVAAGEETIRVTTLAGRAPGNRVHLERALRPSDRMGGHIVQGHVDGIARVSRISANPQFATIHFEAPAELARYIAPKGSVCLDGVSLTVNGIEGNTFWVGIVPHTLQATRMGELRPGDRVNLETDLIARYLERLTAGPGVTLAGLRAAGFLPEGG